MGAVRNALSHKAAQILRLSSGVGDHLEREISHL